MDSPAQLKPLLDPRWRLDNLYWIIDKEGRRVQFKLNWAQERLLSNMDYMNAILKARQLGFTTFIQIFMLDAAVFNSNVRAGTIAHRMDDAKTIFRDKVKYPYDSLPEGIRSRRRIVSDSAEELLLSNNSSIRVSASHRSGTLNYLHISEYGKLCAQFPEKAREVRTGALETVAAGQIVFVESTAEGQEGHFFDICQAGQARARMGATITPLDFKFHFFPWFECPEYQLDPAGVVIPDYLRRYFDKIAATHGIVLSERQQAWYVKKEGTLLSDMKREYPSTPEEAFEASLEGAYYAEPMAIAEHQARIGDHKPIADVPVNTAWDIGHYDATAIWFWQKVLGKICLVGYYENSGEGMPFYIDRLREYRTRFGWQYGAHLLPHDAKVTEWGSGRTRVEQMIDALRSGVGGQPHVVPRAALEDGHNAVRATIPISYFSEAECAGGIKALKAYRKEWDENRGSWKDKPRHDWSSHGESAFRTMAMGWREVDPELNEKPKTVAEIIADMIRPKTFDEHMADLDEREQEEAA